MRFTLGSPYGRRRGYRRSGGGKLRLIIAGVIALIALGSYFFSASENPITGEKQRIGNFSEADEVRMGYSAAPEIAEQMGGAVPSDSPGQRTVERVGAHLLAAELKDGKSLQQLLDEKDVPWRFTFTLLEDDETVNAFALPGGPVFITEALYNRLENEAQLAGVLGHEIGHVIDRHGLQRLAKANLLQGLAGAAGVAAEDGSGRGIGAAAAAAAVGQILQLGYGREDELESDNLGLGIIVAAGYDPSEMIRVMEILRDASGSGGGSGGPPEFLQTHPHPESRIKAIREYVQSQFPDGIPGALDPGEPLKP